MTEPTPVNRADVILEKIEQLEAFALSRPGRDYWIWGCENIPLPIKAESELLSVLESFCHLSQGEVRLIRKRLTEDLADLLPAFAVRMASYAVRENSAIILQTAFVSLTLEDKADNRGIIVALCLVCDAARRINFSAEQFFLLVKKAPPSRRKLMTQYLKKRRNQEVFVMSFEPTITPAGFLYVPTKPW